MSIAGLHVLCDTTRTTYAWLSQWLYDPAWCMHFAFSWCFRSSSDAHLLHLAYNWRRSRVGRTLVTYPILRQTASWTGDHFVDQTSTISQPTWPTQPSIPPMSLACAMHHCRSATTSTVVQRYCASLSNAISSTRALLFYIVKAILPTYCNWPVLIKSDEYEDYNCFLALS